MFNFIVLLRLGFYGSIVEMLVYIGFIIVLVIVIFLIIEWEIEVLRGKKKGVRSFVV